VQPIDYVAAAALGKPIDYVAVADRQRMGFLPFSLSRRIWSSGARALPLEPGASASGRKTARLSPSHFPGAPRCGVASRPVTREVSAAGASTSGAVAGGSLRLRATRNAGSASVGASWFFRLIIRMALLDVLVLWADDCRSVSRSISVLIIHLAASGF
jgi:hypothetical protein